MVACYARVSTSEQAENGHSIDEQKERLQKYCESFGWTVFEMYVDAGFSGSNTDRPALQKLIRDVKDHKVDKVLVYKLDRLSRSQKDTLELIEDIFLSNKCDFISMSENFDTSSPFGRAMIGILSVFAQLEREQIKERMSMGKTGRAKKGGYHGGGYLPVGYDYKDGQLVINEYEAMQVRELHELFQSGHTYYNIVSIFDSKGYSHKHGVWTVLRVKKVLKNDLYIGMITHNGQKFQGQHEPIISKETYFETMRLIGAMDTSKFVHPHRTTYFGGMLYCAQCGGRFCASTFNRNGKSYRYYSCHSRRKTNKTMVKDPNCKNKIYKMDEFDEMIFDEIRKLSADKSGVHKIRSKSNEFEKSEIIKKEIAKIDEQKSRFLDLYGIGQISIDELQGKISPLNERKCNLEAELERIEAHPMTEEKAFELISSFEDVLEHGTFEEIRMLVHMLIERIDIDDDDIQITWKFS